MKKLRNVFFATMMAAAIMITSLTSFAATTNATTTTKTLVDADKIESNSGMIAITTSQNGEIVSSISIPNSEGMSKEDQEKMEAEFKKFEAEMKAKMEKINKTWNALTDKQKEEVYKILEKQVDDEIALVKKCVELGLTDKKDGDKAIKVLEEKKKLIRENKEGVPYLGIAGPGAMMGVTVEMGAKPIDEKIGEVAKAEQVEKTTKK